MGKDVDVVHSEPGGPDGAPSLTPTIDATERAIAAAAHLTEADEGALAALRVLARKIDEDAVLRMAYVRWYQQATGKLPDKPLQMDNVSIPTYLKYAEALGLTPTGREKLTAKTPEGKGGTLGKLRSVHGKSA